MSEQSPKTFGQIASFTPVFDEVVKTLGLLEAAVFGRVWRYCQARDEKCWASHARIGKELGLSPRTVLRKLDRLVEAGYLFKQPRQGDSSIFTIKPEAYTSLPMTESHMGSDRKSKVRKTESRTKIQMNKQQESINVGKPTSNTPPAVKVFRKNAHRFPAKSWWIKLDQEIGEREEDLKFWGEVVFAWVGMGWNPTNVKNMLGYFRRGEVPGEKKQKEPAGFQAIRQHVSEKANERR